MAIHIVEQGETIYSIAQEYGVSPGRLAYDNQTTGQEYLVLGQALLVLVPELTHRIVQGETLYSLAERYETTIRKLLRNNPFLLAQETLLSGEQIVISYTADMESIGKREVTGYAYPFIEVHILREALLYIDELLVFSYGYTATGELLPPIADDDWMIAEAKRFGVKPILVLTPFEEGRFNNALVTVAIEDEEAQERLIQNLLAKVIEKGFAGIDVDFEYILPQDREGYALFVGRLREVMNANGYQVSVALVPKTSADQPGLLYEGMDYKLLGENADKVFLMTYEWGYTYGPPMAVAPIHKVEEVLDYAVTEIVPSKILMGVPNYAYDWLLPFVRGTTRAELIGNVEAVQIAAGNGARISFDTVSMSPWFLYTNTLGEHEVWFEDVRSIDVKLRTAAQYNFRGVGYWNLMRTFRANWLLVNLLVSD